MLHQSHAFLILCESTKIEKYATAECVRKGQLQQIAISDYSMPVHSNPGWHVENTAQPPRMGMDPGLFDQHLNFGPLLWKIWSLRTLELEIMEVLEFTDAFVERLANACPQVTHLRLCGPPFEKRIASLDRAPGMSLNSLQILADKCPELSELQIEIDATRLLPDSYAQDGAGLLRKHELIELGVGMSPVSSQSEKVAA